MILSVKDLINEFKVVIDTAEGLNELRSLILGLAVRGKLVPQDPNDEPASELLKKIEVEQSRLYDEGKIRKPKDLDPLLNSDQPFDIPNNWVWERMGNISDVIRGITFPGSEKKDEKGSDDILCLKTSNIQDKVEWDDVIYVDESYVKREDQYLQENDIVISMANSYELVGKVALAEQIPENSSFGGFLSVIRPFLFDPLYYFYLLRSNYVQEAFRESSSQTVNIANISLKVMLPLPMPLPPLAEQHRIVQKIESLFAEVDDLKEKLKRQTKLDEKLQKAVNAEVQRAPNAEASKSAWNFITSNFDTLYHTPVAIDNLKKNILNEAVRGRLVPQNPGDEPASVLLKKIEAKIERLYEKGEIRKPKELPPIKGNENPFEIPDSWEWTNFNEAGLINPRNEAKDGQEASFISMSLISEGYMEMHEAETRQWKEIKSGYTHFAENDIGLAKITPCFQNGKAAIFRGLKNGIGAGTTELYVFRSIIDGLIPEYVYAFIKTSMYISNGISKMTGTAGHQRIPRDYFEATPFPLPPTQEQHRIVKRIEELFAICDRFKAQLEQREKVNERLVKGLVGEVLEGGLG